MRSCVVVVIAAVWVSGCTDPAQANNPIFNTRLGRVTGVFAGYRPQDFLCELIQIGETHLNLSMYRDTEHEDLAVTFDPLPRINERFQQAGFFQYKLSEPRVNPAFSLLEWGQPIDDRRKRSVPTKYIPLYVHRIRVPAAKVCDSLVTTDCLDVPESEIADSTFWCEDLRTP